MIALTIFAFDNENKAIILDPSSVNEKTLLEAAESYTANAIIIEDDSSQQLYP